MEKTNLFEALFKLHHRTMRTWVQSRGTVWLNIEKNRQFLHSGSDVRPSALSVGEETIWVRLSRNVDPDRTGSSEGKY
jgi:hypothetical protein